MMGLNIMLTTTINRINLLCLKNLKFDSNICILQKKDFYKIFNPKNHKFKLLITGKLEKLTLES